jgi:hypothetical protein
VTQQNVTYSRCMLPRSRAESWGQLGMVAALALPVFLFVYLGRAAAVWLTVPRTLVGVVLIGLLVVLLGPICFRRFVFRWRLRPSETRDTGNEARITLIDLPDGLSAYGPWDDVTFEPEEFYAPFSLGPTRWHVLVAVLVGLGCAGCMLFFFHTGVLPSLPLRARIESILTVPLFAGCLSSCLLRPAYLRISPGLLEIVSRSVVSGRVRTIQRHDLTKGRVTIDLWRLVARVSDSRGDSIFALHLVRDHRKCAWFLVLAALSTHSWPSKP